MNVLVVLAVVNVVGAEMLSVDCHLFRHPSVGEGGLNFEPNKRKIIVCK